jgi:ADP-dependent NAD(P)H-hydrate dehydratase
LATAIKITSKLARQLVVPRKASSKKGDNGIILVVGGSSFYHGAPVLTSMAALRTGADLVYTAVPRSVIVPVRSYSPAIIALPMPDDKLTVGAANRIAAMVPKKADAAAIGMGMSIAKPEALVTLVAKLKDAGTKLLLDASALIPEVLKEIGNVGTVVTPHAGEYRRLFQTEAGKTADERAANVHKMAQEHGVTVLLKGPVDVISDGKRVGLNSTHNPAMTVGGTGDVLSGITASLMTRMEPFNAALLAAYFNGLAGNLAYKQVGLHMTSDDLVEALPSAIKPFDRIVR